MFLDKCSKSWLIGKLILYIINYGFLTTETNLKALYIFHYFCLQSFVYNCVFWKKEKDTHETFHILKMKTRFEEEPRFENESSF